ncbi:MAG: tyrosine-type recombinase/integrase [Pseudomonadota bacterium]
MPKKAKELSATEVRRLTTPGLHAVGGVSGLLLRVTKTGSASWILRVMAGNRRRDIGLGGFPDVPLAQARVKARETKEQIKQGIDPVEQRKAARDALIAAQAKELSFKEAAIQCHKVRAAEFRNVKHAKDWINSLERYVFPVFGSLPVAEVDVLHVLETLRPIWETRTETATRVRQRIEAVLAWATVSRYRSGDNPARWSGNLEATLAKPAKASKVKHHRALPWQEIPGFMTALRKMEGMGARALEFAILTAARSGEVRLATWEEIDLGAKLWTIPGERMKAGKPHRVPLSDDAVKLLKEIPRLSEYVFTAPRGGVLSDMSMSAVTRRMKVDAVPHGFRSSFKDWARSSTAYPDEVSELALAHVNSDATRAAYARDELLPKRARLMADWSKFLNAPAQSGEVVPMRKNADG